MDYAEWRGLYADLRGDFGFSEKEDMEAARILNDMVEPISVESLEKVIAHNKVCVYGAGDSLMDVEDFPGCTRIAADGATSYLLRKSIIPDVVVTDLDGRIEDLYNANSRGSIMVIHAHGDNIDKIKAHVPRFSRVIPTCQCKPFARLQNFGGFTDGDRAVFMAEHFKAREILLYGMDFGEVGGYSFSEDTPIKRKKLKWGERLIDYVRQRGHVAIREG